MLNVEFMQQLISDDMQWQCVGMFDNNMETDCLS